MIPEYKLYVLKDNDNLDSFLSYNIQVASNISIKTAFNGNQLIVTKCKYKSWKLLLNFHGAIQGTWVSYLFVKFLRDLKRDDKLF